MSGRSPHIFDPELRARYRLHLARCREIVDAHAEAALSATGGDAKKAARILAAKAAADPRLKLEVDALDRLNALFGWPVPDPKRTLAGVRAKGNKLKSGRRKVQ